MTTRTLLVLAVAFVALAGRPDSAVADRAAVVIGGATSAEQPSVVEGASAAVTRAKWTVVEHALSKDRVAAAVECAERDDRSDCAPRVLAEADADRLVVLRLTNDKYEGKPVRVVTARVIGGVGEVLAIGQRFCEGCTNTLLEMHVGELVGELLQEAKRRLAPATLVVRSVPDQARVAVDGTIVGVTELEYGVAAGKRQLRVEKDGYSPVLMDVVVRDGERREVDVELVPEEPEGKGGAPKVTRPNRSRSSKLAPWIVIGAGAAAVATGAVLFALDEDEVEGGEYQREWTDTATPGVVVGIAGLVAAGGGVGWLLSMGDAGDSVSPAVTVGRGGAQVGIRGSF